MKKIPIHKGVFHLWLGLLFILPMTYAEAPAEAGSPTERVRGAVTNILTVLKNKNLDRDTKWQEIGRVIDEGFDFRSMSQSVLATHWRTASPEEKRQRKGLCPRLQPRRWVLLSGKGKLLAKLPEKMYPLPDCSFKLRV